MTIHFNFQWCFENSGIESLRKLVKINVVCCVGGVEIQIEI